ncbi:hypothetical protein DV737_g1252, partial [Chaetothyriales sp. CBS 132003]
MVASKETWAVIAGIDRYPDQQNWLHGAAGDALRIRRFLVDALKVREDNIDLLLLPHKGQEPTGIAYKYPSNTNILASLSDTCLKGKAGDIVWFYFAGHGDRVSTMHPTLKEDTKIDEVICAADGDIEDVKLDAILTKFVQNDIQTLAVLDCCHSGGATRDKDDTRIRCRSRNAGGQHSTAFRGMNVRQTWFYQHRKYHLLAACQPFQGAKEASDGGVFTSSLLKIFNASADCRRLSFRTVQQRLDTQFAQNIFQNPLILGDGDANIGGTVFAGHTAVSITVSKVDNSKITLNKGTAAGVNVGDVYELFPPTDNASCPTTPSASIMVTVSQVDGLESWCHYHESPAPIAVVKPGYVAHLYNKASLVTIAISSQPHLSAGLRASRQTLLQEISLDTTGMLPFSFFDGEIAMPQSSPDYLLYFNQDGLLEIQDKQFRHLTPIPRIQHDDKHLLNKIMSVLRHIYAYCMLRDLQPPTNAKKPLYDFEVREVEASKASKAEKVLASKEIFFKNRESLPTQIQTLNHTQFITILNLTSSFGVGQILPYDDDQSIAVEPGKAIPELIIDILAPENFGQDGASLPEKLRDTLKLFITARPQSFAHHLQDDFQDVIHNQAGSFRKARARVPERFDWWCDQLDIMTPLSAPNVLAANMENLNLQSH